MYIIWACIAILFLFLDLVKRNKQFLVFATTFMFLSVVAFKFTNDFICQFFGFIFFYGIFSFLICGALKKEQKDLLKIQKQKNIVGKIATVTKDIAKTFSIDGLGLVEVDNEIWQAKSVNDKEIKAGKEVKIKSRENFILNVEEVSCGTKD